MRRLRKAYNDAYDLSPTHPPCELFYVTAHATHNRLAENKKGVESEILQRQLKLAPLLLLLLYTNAFALRKTSTTLFCFPRRLIRFVTKSNHTI